MLFVSTYTCTCIFKSLQPSVCVVMCCLLCKLLTVVAVCVFVSVSDALSLPVALSPCHSGSLLDQQRWAPEVA